MQDVIIDILAFMLDDIVCLAVICGKQAVSQSWHVVKLLQHRVHIAHCPQILDAAVAVPASSIRLRRETWLLRLINSVDLPQPVVFEDFFGQTWNFVRLANREQEIKGCLDALLGMTLVHLLALYWLQMYIWSNMFTNGFKFQAE